MRTQIATVATASLLALTSLPDRAAAQYCPDPVLITCGDTVSGDTQYGPDWLSEYSCIGNYTLQGPENHYQLLVPECSELTITLDPSGFDAALLVLSEVNGTCRADMCMAVEDVAGSSGTEVLQATADAGTFALVVDGYQPFIGYSYGPYTLDVQCVPHPECVDADGDGVMAIDGACPCGRDCDDADPEVYPGRTEICGDGVDQDCQDGDEACPTCAATQDIACDDAGTTDLSGLVNNIAGWCDSPNDWTGREAIFGLTMDTDAGLRFTTSANQDVDLIVVRPYADGVCNPDACITNSVEAGGQEQVDFYGHQGQTYYIAVDGYQGANPTVDWALTCFDEACAPGPVATCDQVTSGDSDTGTNAMTHYSGFIYPFPADEQIHTFTPAGDALVTIGLSFGGGLDLALLVLEDDGGGCHPANVIAASDLDNSVGPSDETVTFQAVAGTTYYLVVDGWQIGDQGPYELDITCASTCPPGTTACGAECVDTSSDMDHCGACDTPCAPANGQGECQAGVCQITACDAGFDDCDGDPATGCEADLASDDTCGSCDLSCTTPEFCFEGGCTDQCPGGLTNCSGSCVDTTADPAHCGGCDQPCAFAHGQAACTDSACVLQACDAGWGDCNTDDTDGCEADTTSDPLNCGGCDQPCDPGLVCNAGGCTDQCPGGLTNCSGACVDTDTDMAHCGACDTPCVLENGTGQCAAGACSLVACDSGFGDCNADLADGCETGLGDVANCTACGDACSWANGSGQCTQAGCEFTACDAGFGDCNADLADGCEATLGSAEHCAACGDACAFDNADGECAAGACQMGACWANFADCNADPADGCEADLRSNATCGSCDVACQPTEACDQGVCESNCQDLDGDGHSSANCGGTDCNDYDPNTYPGAAEVCGDGIDQDCSGADLPCGNCQDADADGYQDATCGGNDCNDADANIHPGAEEICGDGIDQDCSGADQACGGCHDNDSDGYEDWICGGDDCDDTNNAIHPGATEVCGDGVDQDCDGSDESCGCDADGDGHADISCGGLDCDDTNARIYPGAIDDCGDGIDQNCDGEDRPCPGGGSGCGCVSAGTNPLAGWSLLLGLLGLAEYRRRRKG